MTITLDRTAILTIMGKGKMTSLQLAQASGISRQNISAMLRRGTCLPVTAGKLAAGLGCQLEDIIERK